MPVSNLDTDLINDTISGQSAVDSVIFNDVKLAGKTAIDVTSGNVIGTISDSVNILEKVSSVIIDVIETTERHNEIEKIVKTESDLQLDNDLDSLRRT